LADFRKIMKEIRTKNTKPNFRLRKNLKQYA
jgi:G:T-mismatch repair DNA endonuclease (very short patch repair protein)